MLDRTPASEAEIEATMRDIGARARAAARTLATATAERKHAALTGAAQALMRRGDDVLNANAIDMENGREVGLSKAMLDRLDLDTDRLRAIAGSLRSVAELPDPVGSVIASWTRPNGLRIERVRTPLGVVGVIFESRPNVTADAGALCLKSGNAVILRGGSDAFNTNRAIHEAMVEGVTAAGLPADAVQLVPVTDRAAVGHMLRGLDGNVDVIVPRGGRSLVERVQAEARVPVFAHLEGLCHVYVDGSADPDMARRIVVDAKMRRTGICGAAETILFDRAAAGMVAPVVEALKQAGCEVRGDAEIAKLADVAPATETDWATEYLDAIVSIAMVDGVGGAIEHIARWSSDHTEAVIAESPSVVRRFMDEVDSAILLHNASTQFADGGEFGMGAEIGIATGRMHARGPVGIEQLCSFKYRVFGEGQVRG